MLLDCTQVSSLLVWVGLFSQNLKDTNVSSKSTSTHEIKTRNRIQGCPYISLIGRAYLQSSFNQKIPILLSTNENF